MQHLLRRKIAFCVCLCMLSAKCFAQLDNYPNLPDFDDKKIHFGINIGLNSSHFHFNFDPYFLQQDSVLDVESLNNIGINLAWLANFKLNDNFAIRTYPLDLTFSQRPFHYNLTYPDASKGETAITLKQVQSITLSLPVQLEFNSDRIGNFRVYTITGAQASLDLASTAGDKNNNGTIELNPFDFGIQCGIGFHLY